MVVLEFCGDTGDTHYSAIMACLQSSSALKTYISDISQTSPEQFGGNRAEIQPFLHFHFPAELQLRQLNMAGDNQMAGDHLLKLPVQLRKENPDILQHCC